MSILVAYRKGDTVYMGTDTRVIVNDFKKNELCESNYKIQRLDNGILLGVTAERIERQTIFANSDIFSLDKNRKLTRKHIVKEIIPRLMALLKEEDLLVEKEDELSYMQAIILIAYKDTLYEIGSTFCVIRYEEFQVLGSAGEYAMPTIANTKDTDDVNERIIKSLTIAQKHCIKVGAPFLLIDTKEQKYKLVGGK